MSRFDAAWHRTHPMPPRATLEQRILWHLGHAKACGCRPIPGTVRRALEERRTPGRKGTAARRRR